MGNVTAVLVSQAPNSLRYLVTAAGAGNLVIAGLGGVTPDLITDTVAGPLKQLASALANGIGQIPAGAQTTAQVRGYLASDNTGANIGTFDVPRAVAGVTPRSGVGCDWIVDAITSGGGTNPQNAPAFNITAAAAGTCYLDIAVQGAIGR